MSTPTVPAQNWTQFNFVDGDTFKVIEKQNGFNASLEVFQTAINNMVAALNEDVAFVEQAREELDADNIVHAPGSGLPNEAGNVYSRNVGIGPEQIPLNSNLGEAAYRAVTGGAGGVMAQGAFRLGEVAPTGGSPTGGELSATTFTRYPTSASSPFGRAGTGFRTRYTGGGDAHELHIDAGTGEIRTRVGSGNGSSVTWGAPLRHYNKNNIVGALSEGAAIERGSNSFGSYVRYIDGTLECMTPLVTLTRSNDNSANFNWTFPYPFGGNYLANLAASFDTSSASYTGAITQQSVGQLYKNNTSFPTSSASVGVLRSSGSNPWLVGDEIRNVIFTIKGRWD